MDIARNKVVGEVLACIRREHSLTQADVAERVGYTQSAISKTEAILAAMPKQIVATSGLMNCIVS